MVNCPNCEKMFEIKWNLYRHMKSQYERQFINLTIELLYGR